MTISSTTRIAQHNGNGSASTFAFSFKVFAASDLQVILLTNSTGVEATLALTTDYTVTLNGNQNTNPGGSITLVAGALAVGFTLTITSDIANLQPTDLTNQGGFYPEVITDALDRATIQIQQISDIGDRTIKIPISDGTGLDMQLPSASARANRYLVFDASGLPSTSTGSGTDGALRSDLAATGLSTAGSGLVGFRASNAASVGRTVLSRLRDTISVMDFGAVGDGVTDDTTAFTNAVTAAGTRNVFVPGGSYKITGTVTGSFYTDSTVTIVTGTVNTISRIGSVLSTAGTLTVGGNTINSAGGTTAITMSGANVSVSGDLTVTGNDINSSTATVFTMSGANVTAAGNVTATGNVTLSTGNLIVATIGKGIDFSATANGSGVATSELLDDFEQGTWTPVYTSATGTFTTLTMNVVSATYTKIGNLVTASAHIRTDNVSLGTASGNIYVSGFPYQIGSFTNGGGAVFGASGWATDHPGALWGDTANLTRMVLLYRNTAGNSQTTAIQHTDLTTGAVPSQNTIIFTTTYLTS